MVVLCGPDHVDALVNDAYRRIVGERDLTGKPMREALPELAGQGFFELLDQVYATLRGAECTGPDTLSPVPVK